METQERTQDVTDRKGREMAETVLLKITINRYCKHKEREKVSVYFTREMNQILVICSANVAATSYNYLNNADSLYQVCAECDSKLQSLMTQ